MNPEEKVLIRDKWRAIIESGKRISLQWDAGGDETLVSVFVDGVEADWAECDDIVMLVIEVLDLPNAGEFFVNGGGELLTANEKLLIKYESKHSGIDYRIPEGEEFDPETFDFEENAVEIEKNVSETVELI